MTTTRLILVGGFLGAGKTTLLWEAARRLTARGTRVGLVTNDQAPDLVDTALLSRSGVGVREVAGSCFCCNFPGLTQAVANLSDTVQAEVVLAEPVGSCTDLSATILQPLKDRFAQTCVLAPLTVLADPSRLREVMESGRSGSLHDSAIYIFRKQMEEADLIAINKSDLLTPDALRDLIQTVQRRFPCALVLPVSASTGAGVDTWIDAVLADAVSGRRIADVDYDRYAEGEAVLGWLNASAVLTAVQPVDWPTFARAFLTNLQDELRKSRIEVGHIKMLLEAETGRLVANLTRTDGEISIRNALKATPGSVSLTVNARAQMHPTALEALTRAALTASAGDAIRIEIRHLRCLQPGRPRPTHRYATPVHRG